MELAPTLTGHTVQNRVRAAGINPHHWYPVAWSSQLRRGKVLPVQVWGQAIALFRDDQGQVHALEDACPHKGVALHKGEVQGQNLTCPYHGWQFAPDGRCVAIPYFPPEQKLPCVQARRYPVQDQYGMVWVFPGDGEQAPTVPLPSVPEYDDPQWLRVAIPGQFNAHFSICNENTMDVFHGFLHRNLQGWFNPKLLQLRQSDTLVEADYQVSYQGWLSQFLGMGRRGDRITTRTISIQYRYPHYANSLEGVSKMYLMRLPVSPTETRSFTLLFLKIRLPQTLTKMIRPLLSRVIWRFLFKPFLDQDVEMVESEQQTYHNNPQRHYIEVNPAIIALQRVMLNQAHGAGFHPALPYPSLDATPSVAIPSR
ncbi:MAG: aromatic ring-hydroxylating dioxygenase subunit alpha [Spirulina sp. DLM2.Bin59]|nr:MAG: aromatic ring-hydroxylating dioxygenase subunit alpha [Spirulina sp. DLM2.Bin59]